MPYLCGVVAFRKRLIKKEYERNWYECPKCGQKLLIYNNDASSEGVFILCKRCKHEVEIKITRKH